MSTYQVSICIKPILLSFGPVLAAFHQAVHQVMQETISILIFKNLYEEDLFCNFEDHYSIFIYHYFQCAYLKMQLKVF